jgi:putative ABC transport system ATP-binding protein
MIETRALRYDYPRGPSLAFPDLDVPQGATLLLRGNSGAGKSTWLALAAGLLTASAGEVAVAGQPLSSLSRAARDGWRARHLGYLPQKLHLSDALSVERNLALAFYAAGLPGNRNAVRRALEQLGVAELAGRRPSQLSGGQAQRVALARSILMEPKVILADEPTASLDDEAALAGLKLLESCAFRCNATLVIATHDRRVQEALPAAMVYRIGSLGRT